MSNLEKLCDGAAERGGCSWHCLSSESQASRLPRRRASSGLLQKPWRFLEGARGRRVCSCQDHAVWWGVGNRTLSCDRDGWQSSAEPRTSFNNGSALQLESLRRSRKRNHVTAHDRRSVRIGCMPERPTQHSRPGSGCVDSALGSLPRFRIDEREGLRQKPATAGGETLILTAGGLWEAWPSSWK